MAILAQSTILGLSFLLSVSSSLKLHYHLISLEPSSCFILCHSLATVAPMSMLKSFIRLRPLRRAHQPVIPTRFFASTSISSGYSLHSAQSKTAPSIRHIPSLTHFPNNSLSRSFHSTNRRQDVLFVAMPALKSGLLNITRFTLLFLPFAIRYK